MANHPSLILGQPIRIQPTNGFAGTNLLTGSYRFMFTGLNFTRPLLFNVPDDTNTYNVLELMTNGLSWVTTNLSVVRSLSLTQSTNWSVAPASGHVVLTVNTNTGGGGTSNWTDLTNKPAPILLVSTNDGSTLTNLGLY